jgi:hypothetical protein
MQSNQPKQQGSGFQLNGRTILIILVVLGIIFVISRLGNQASAPVEPTLPPAVEETGMDIGRIFTTTSVDRDGCPTENVTTFRATDSIFVAAEESSIPAGTAIFARLYLDNRAVEDTDEIVADDDMTACFNFVFENNEGFEPGSYEAEIIVNGNPVGSASFTIR